MLARCLVINTNVLDSAALKPGASNDISICTKPTRLYVLAPILVEDPNVLSRPELGTRKVLRLQLPQHIKNRSHIVEPSRRFEVMSDPEDNVLVERADAARADYLITGNQKHFPASWKSTKIITSREFASLAAPHLFREESHTHHGGVGGVLGEEGWPLDWRCFASGWPVGPSTVSVPALSDGAEDCLPQRFVVLFECVHERTNHAMPRIAVEDNSRMSLRIRATEKALLLRAVALDHTDLTDFVLRHALSAAKAVIQEADHVQLSERDSLRVLDLLENPPAPTASLLAAAQALPQRS
jgi:putative PIN family toxin of toxin-antitoxin system